MKALKLFAFGITMIAVQGCYTVLWTPDVAFPTKELREDSDSFYEEIYYGEYSPYYEIPWWYTIPPPPSFVTPVRVRDTQETLLRSGGTTDRGTPEIPILLDTNPPPPSRDQPPSTNPPTTDGDNSSTKTESTTKEREKGNSSNSRDTRNNDGSRSSDTPRR